ncbi:hypothetical protein ACA910_013525 [Epithemia clementina (nom. ined.)]
MRSTAAIAPAARTCSVLVTLMLILDPHQAWTSTVNALSTHAPPSTAQNKAAGGGGGWSAVAIKAAKDMSETQLEKLRQAGLLEMQRPIRIVGEPVVGSTTLEKEDGEKDNLDSSCSSSTTTTTTITKTIHFQRHGQGYHNFICDLWREWGRPIDFDSTDPTLNPIVRPELLDPPLTSLGIDQCRARREQCAQLNPELVIVSPLLRCLQTAQSSFRDHLPPLVPWVAHEGCREELGLLMGNKRRPIAELEQEFGHQIDFSPVEHNEDVLWENYGNARESLAQKTDRIYDFLTNFVVTRPEEEIAIVTHSAYLFTMLNAVVEVQDPDLKRWFLTSEVRSMKLRFVLPEK